MAYWCCHLANRIIEHTGQYLWHTGIMLLLPLPSAVCSKGKILVGIRLGCVECDHLKKIYVSFVVLCFNWEFRQCRAVTNGMTLNCVCSISPSQIVLLSLAHKASVSHKLENFVLNSLISTHGRQQLTKILHNEVPSFTKTCRSNLI